MWPAQGVDSGMVHWGPLSAGGPVVLEGSPWLEAHGCSRRGWGGGRALAEGAEHPALPQPLPSWVRQYACAQPPPMP
eukprot:3916366-Alexandrium_andersonii.AAC.2